MAGGDLRPKSPLPPWSAFFGDWLPLGRKWHSWVAIKGQGFQGLIAATPRSSSRAWQIAHLILAEEDPDLGSVLLQALTAAAGQRGAEKIFLRLPQDSHLLEVAKNCQFCLYQGQRLYYKPGGAPSDNPSPPPGLLRPKSPADDYPLFQLYSQVMPESIRLAEGMTFPDWQDSREKEAGQEWVWEKEGQVRGCLRVRNMGKGKELAFLVLAEGEPQELWHHSLSRLGGNGAIYCLAYHLQATLQRYLSQEGFEPVAEYLVLVKHLAVPVRQTCLAPMQA